MESDFKIEKNNKLTPKLHDRYMSSNFQGTFYTSFSFEFESLMLRNE